MISNDKLDSLIKYYSNTVENIKQFPLPGDYTEEKEDVIAALKELHYWREARSLMEDRLNGSPQCYWVTIEDVLRIVDNGCKN